MIPLPQIKHTVTSLLFLLLTTCTIGPDYKRPTQEVPKTWSNLLEEQKDATQTVKWWENFNDPILNQLIDQVAKQNLDLKGAQALIIQNQALLKRAEANLFPLFTLGANASANEGSENYYLVRNQRKYNLYTVAPSVSWELDLFGKLARAKEAALADLNAQIATSYGVFLSLVSNVAQTYVRLRTAQNQLKITRHLCEKYKAIYDLRRDLKKSGLINQIDVESSKSVWETYKAMKYPLKAAIKNYMHALSALTSQEPTALYELLNPIGKIPRMDAAVFSGLPSDLLERRPDIQQAEMTLAGATARIGVAEGGLYPSFNLTGSIGYQSLNSSNLISSDSLTYSVGPGLTWDIFDFGRVRDQILATEALKNNATLLYRQTILNALAEVENALVNYANELKKIADLEKSKKALQQVLNLNQSRFDAGLDPVMPTLQAEADFLSKKLDVLGSASNLALDIINLYKALGGGWQVL